MAFLLEFGREIQHPLEVKDAHFSAIILEKAVDHKLRFQPILWLKQHIQSQIFSRKILLDFSGLLHKNFITYSSVYTSEIAFRQDQINLVGARTYLHCFYLKVKKNHPKKGLFNFFKIVLDILSRFTFLFNNKINKISVFFVFKKSNNLKAIYYLLKRLFANARSHH